MQFQQQLHKARTGQVHLPALLHSQLPESGNAPLLNEIRANLTSIPTTCYHECALQEKGVADLIHFSYNQKRMGGVQNVASLRSSLNAAGKYVFNGQTLDATCWVFVPSDCSAAAAAGGGWVVGKWNLEDQFQPFDVGSFWGVFRGIVVEFVLLHGDGHGRTSSLHAAGPASLGLAWRGMEGDVYRTKSIAQSYTNLQELSSPDLVPCRRGPPRVIH